MTDKSDNFDTKPNSDIGFVTQKDASENNDLDKTLFDTQPFDQPLTTIFTTKIETHGQGFDVIRLFDALQGRQDMHNRDFGITGHRWIDADRVEVSFEDETSLHEARMRLSTIVEKPTKPSLFKRLFGKFGRAA